MTWDPMKFWEGYEHGREYFDPVNERSIHAQYLLKHQETQALASLFVAHMCKNPTRRPEVTLKEAGLFFTRPAEVLQDEVNNLDKKFGRYGPKEELRKKPPQIPVPRAARSTECVCSSIYSTSLSPVFSSFISLSTSASTITTVTEKGIETPTLDEALWQIVMKAFDEALRKLYSERVYAVLYDEAYLCLMRCCKKAVKRVWRPRLEEINDVIDSLIGDAVLISIQEQKLKKLMSNKVPLKINRLRDHFKGFAENEDYPKLKRKEMLKTLHTRLNTFNRYPKDKFGVYLPSDEYDVESLEETATYIPEPCEHLDDEEKRSVHDETLEDFSDYEDD